MRRLTSVLVAAGLLVAGCGSGGNAAPSTSKGGTPVTTAAPTTAAPTTTVAPTTTSTTLPTAEALIAKSKEAMKKAKSFHMVLNAGTEGADYAGSATGDWYKMTIKRADQQADIVTVDGVSYAKGNAAFYKANGIDPATVGDNWVKGLKTPSSPFKLDSFYDTVPKNQQVTAGTVDGKPVHQLKEKDGSVISIDPATSLPVSMVEPPGGKGRSVKFGEWDSVSKPAVPSPVVEAKKKG